MTSQTSFDDIVGLAAPTTDTDTTSTNPANPAQAEDNGAKYPNVVRTYNFGDLPEGENPPGTATVSEFAGLLTVDNIQAGKGVDGIVQPANVNNWLTGKRFALPVVLVFAEGAALEQDKAKAFISIDAGKEAYRNRPEPGTAANGATSTLDDDDLLRRAGKSQEKLEFLTDKVRSYTEKLTKATELAEKYNKWLTERGLNWDKVAEIMKADAEKAEVAEESAPDTA